MQIEAKLGAAVSACTREGESIGRALELLQLAVVSLALGIAGFLLIATTIGWYVGRRRGDVEGTVRCYLRRTVMSIIATSVAIALSMMIWEAVVRVRNEFRAAEIMEWIRPLQNAKSGSLSIAIEKVVNAEGAQSPGRRAYLVAELPRLLGPMDRPPVISDRTAILNLLAQLQRENEERSLGIGPDNMSRLEGWINWFAWGPDLSKAIILCKANDYCVLEVLGGAEGWCIRQGAACASALGPDQLAAVTAATQGNYRQEFIVNQLRRRVEAASR